MISLALVIQLDPHDVKVVLSKSISLLPDQEIVVCEIWSESLVHVSFIDVKLEVIEVSGVYDDSSLLIEYIFRFCENRLSDRVHEIKFTIFSIIQTISQIDRKGLKKTKGTGI